MTNQTANVDYQALAVDFTPGDVVIPYGASRDYAGRVVTVWPAIGMVDVEFPNGTKRYPVEDILRLDEKGNPNPPEDGYVPGGAGTVSVPGGPFGDIRASKDKDSFSKNALYWAAADRRYRATVDEIKSNSFMCPKCKKAALKRAIYRRLKGKSERLYGCPGCLFLIERDSILDGGV